MWLRRPSHSLRYGVDHLDILHASDLLSTYVGSTRRECSFLTYRKSMIFPVNRWTFGVYIGVELCINKFVL